MSRAAIDKALAQIARCDDPILLKRWIVNAQSAKQPEIVAAARRRLFEKLPSSEPGTLEHDVWMSIHALEEFETAERGKTVRLQRTRNLIAQIGERDAVEKLLLKNTPSSGYDMLIRHGFPELLFEALALPHPARFSEAALANARARIPERLTSVGAVPNDRFNQE